MNNYSTKVIPIYSNTRSDIRTGTVISVSSGDISINLDQKAVAAKKAFSCIIDPEPGDTILCSENETGILYVLAIIERPNTREMNLSFPSGASIQTNEGGLKIKSTDNVTIVSKDVNCFSKKAIHKSDEAIVSFKNTTACGDELQANFTTVRLISNLINTIAKQVIDRFKGYIRNTEDSDIIKAGQVTRQASGLLSMDSKYTIMNSKESTRIDGEKILMG